MTLKDNFKLRIVGGMILLSTVLSCKQSSSNDRLTMITFEWSQLDSIPDPFGFAGGFSGVSNGALIFAGGANFPDGKAPWTGGVKKWYNSVFVLESPEAQWKTAGTLPIALGYGTSITYNNRFIVIGGSNETGHSDKVWSLIYENKMISIDSLPSLPQPLANSCGAVVNDKIYVAGGLINDTDKNTTPLFWSLNLKNTTEGWQVLSPAPGKSRMLSVAGVWNDRFVLLSGVELVDGVRSYLTDAYVYSEEKGWDTLPDLPYSVAAAPSTAYTQGDQLFIFGGDNGELAAEAGTLREKHPGFETKILQFDFNKKQWKINGEIPVTIKENAAETPNESTWAPVTTNMVEWKNHIIIPSGEVRPAIRTPRILTAKIK
ncbi:galactose oxidase [Gynurincola endophyticus]|uniref:galactose oxidase n=1 Tax=Gynurincola endophyticus TaxID=2479004 RepID=UPI001F31C0E9|nr:galactose oxidase [Gynurincola endophyticus]